MGMLDWLTSQQQPQQPGIGGGMSDLFSNPLTFGALGALGAYADTLEPSRLPKSPLAGLLRGAAGFGQGYLTGQQATTLNSLKDVQLAQQASRLAMMQQYGLLPPGFKIPGAIGSFMGGAAQPAQTAPASGPGTSPAMPPGSLDPNAYQQAGVGSPSPTGGAPPALAPPQVGSGPTGLPFSPDAVRGALAAELIAPGAGAKQLPGPSDIARLYQERQAIAAQNPSDPRLRGYDFAILKAQGIDPVMNLRPGSTAAMIDPTTLQFRPSLQVPNLPEGMQAQYDQNGRATATVVPGVNDQVAALARIQQSAIGARETGQKRLQYQLETGEAPPGGGGGGGGGGPSLAAAPTLPSGGAPAPVSGQPAGPMPSAPLGSVAATPITPPAGAAPPGQAKGGDFTTERGTVIPTTLGNQTIGPGQTQTTDQIKRSGETEDRWNAQRPSIEIARQRLQGLSEAFQQVETGGYTTNRADFSSRLRGLGFNKAADAVMSGADTSAVQQALWNGMQDVLQQLKVIAQGTGGRILNSEFNAFMEHGFTPNMQPSALRKAIVAQYGQTYQFQNMIDDYNAARTRPIDKWRDANQFQIAYLQKNPIEGFVDYADKTVPQFKGMAAPAQAGQNAPAGGRAPMPGAVEGGYRFKGGNPADRNSWEKVQ